MIPACVAMAVSVEESLVSGIARSPSKALAKPMQVVLLRPGVRWIPHDDGIQRVDVGY